MSKTITPRSVDFSAWYHDIILSAKLADYSPVKGCMVIRPNGYAIWEKLYEHLNKKIKESGAKNAYFPMLIPEHFLQKEAQHVEGFAPECAIVTHAGGKKLEEPFVVRPTSETIINSMFAKWIQSYRDLPFLINQWANVVRWEMRTRLFLRTTEFLWQEGHTCHATAQEAEQFAQKMLHVYANVFSEVLALPVILGQKTDSERFAGAEKTYTLEAIMQDGKALQAGTSHFLGTNFAKAFETKFLDKANQLQLVHQTSWGVTTRLIGALVMTHSDDRGLVLPPQLASVQLWMIPILGKDADKAILEKCEQIKSLLKEHQIEAGIDYETRPLGQRLFDAEIFGYPLRIEIGAKEIERSVVEVFRRDLYSKQTVPLDQLVPTVKTLLEQMQKEMYQRAQNLMHQKTLQVDKFTEFLTKNENNGFFDVSWCRSEECEQKIKENAKATIRCIRMDENLNRQEDNRPCFVCQKHHTLSNYRVLVARNY